MTVNPFASGDTSRVWIFGNVTVATLVAVGLSQTWIPRAEREAGAVAGVGEAVVAGVWVLPLLVIAGILNGFIITTQVRAAASARSWKPLQALPIIVGIWVLVPLVHYFGQTLY